MFLVKPRKKRKVTALVRKFGKTGSIPPEQIEAYRKQTQAFRAKFGREMRPDDPFFFDPNADTPQYRSAQDAEFALNLLAEMMTQAGLDPAAVYAFKRTGGLFPTANLPLTDEELEDWAAAIDEYHERMDPKRQ